MNLLGRGRVHSPTESIKSGPDRPKKVPGTIATSTENFTTGCILCDPFGTKALPDRPANGIAGKRSFLRSFEGGREPSHLDSHGSASTLAGRACGRLPGIPCHAAVA